MRVESFDCGSTGSCRKPEFLLRFEPCWPTVGNTVDWPTVVNTVSWPIVVDAVGISQSIPSTQIYTPSSLRCPIKCARVFIHLRQKAQNKVLEAGRRCRVLEPGSNLATFGEKTTSRPNAGRDGTSPRKSIFLSLPAQNNLTQFVLATNDKAFV